MAGRTSVRGIDNIINNLNSIAPRVRTHLKMAADQAVGILHDATVENCSLTCHSLEDLARLGHPYSTRYEQDYLHDDSKLHIQSGWLISNIEKISEVDSKRVLIAVGVDEAKVEYIGWLIDGTWKMRPRDFLGNTFLQEREKLLRIIKYGIVEGLGSRGGSR
jgi:hypothetical protein